mmetsp:Transcript_67306/g.118006  ORF Transcript_67306/g.118006 Transcript_67306/m.118006 type:complete len:486 (+) Transcript_67306:66-1523(+)
MVTAIENAPQGQLEKGQKPDEDDFNADLNESDFERQVSIQIVNAERLLKLWWRGLSCEELGHTGDRKNGAAVFEYSPEKGPRFGELYDVQAQIVGSGAFSVPYPGNFRGRPCVVKVVDKNLVGDEYRQYLVDAGVYEMLLNMSQKQEHPNIVAYYDFLEGPLNYYVVMEQLKGSDLFDQFMMDFPVTEKYIRDTMQQVLSSLEHLHDVVGLVHRDVKLGNFRYAEPSASSKLKLLDFGFARRADSKWEEAISGTVLYLAPEIVAPAGHNQQRVFKTASDVWAAGVMFFIFLCGKEPFKEREVWELGRGGAVALVARCLRHMALNHWSADAKDLLEQLLTINPAKRITAAQALKHPWFGGSRLTLATSPVPRQNYTLAGETSRRATVLTSQKPESVEEGISTRRRRIGRIQAATGSRSHSVGSRSPRSIRASPASGHDLQVYAANPADLDQHSSNMPEHPPYPTYQPQGSIVSLCSDDDHIFLPYD